jgi:hypothetical protein
MFSDDLRFVLAKSQPSMEVQPYVHGVEHLAQTQHENHLSAIPNHARNSAASAIKAAIQTAKIPDTSRLALEFVPNLEFVALGDSAGEVPVKKIGIRVVGSSLHAV